MTLRARLVAALVALFAVGLLVYGVGTYRTFARAELARFDDDLTANLPLLRRLAAERVAGGGQRGGPLGERGVEVDPGPGRGDRPVLLPAGTYAQLFVDGEASGEPLQLARSDAAPDLAALDVDALRRPVTVGSLQGDARWRVAVAQLAGGRRLAVAVPLTAVERSLRRLLVIEVVAGAALLALLAAGSWLVLRRGLAPLEQMAATVGGIGAGALDRRVQVPADGSEVGALGAAVNGMLDDLETAFRERDATEARLRRFLADASHELRTPLTSIRGFAELVRLGADSEHVDAATAVRRIEQESARMGRLVEDLLLLARLDELRPPVREPVDLAVLAADACSDAVATQPDRPLRLDAPVPVPVEADPAHLRQALGNLVANALHHTPPGTPVEVAARREGVTALLEVRDHGPGLDAQALDRVFDRFWQADTARVGAGTGLGLAIVQAIAAEHGGTVTAANAADGGAVFRLSVPVGAPSPAPPTARTGDPS